MLVFASAPWRPRWSVAVHCSIVRRDLIEAASGRGDLCAARQPRPRRAVLAVVEPSRTCEPPLIRCSAGRDRCLLGAAGQRRAHRSDHDPAGPKSLAAPQGSDSSKGSGNLEDTGTHEARVEKAPLTIARQFFFGGSSPGDVGGRHQKASRQRVEGRCLYSTLPAPRRKSASICNRVPPPKRAR
jgi:hypothetical protein